VWVVTPLSVNESLVAAEYYIPDGVNDEVAHESIELSDHVMREDIALCESVQRGLMTGTLEQGRLVLEVEHLLEHFQRLVKEHVAAGP
jgi:choline monooxygenase